MTRKLRRTNELEVALVIKDDGFIRPPHEAQRNALLNKALREFTDDLTALHHVAARFVPGDLQNTLNDRTQSDLTDEEIMEEWQWPLMEAMAAIVGEGHGDVLEIGFGRGIASTMIQEQKVKSHTIIECNDSVVRRYHNWRANYPTGDIRLSHGLWQDTIGGLGRFDGIFFHTYPLNMEEYMQYVSGSITFAQHFFPVAADHLRTGGVFTYMTNEIDSFSRAHQRLLFQYFSSITLKIVPLQMPQNVKDTWWADSMVVVAAVK
ncbi:MAG TPA: class I SAM-dependent methyltransferase [Bacteroidetes bacterium]|nr:class I SAM-dependent methyltransferase [Bacteroidota bacterium]